MTKEEYRKYLKTEHWKTVREEYYDKRRNKRCFACTSRNELNLHHITYSNLYNERFGDFVILCRRCHGMVHRLVGEGACTLENGHIYVRHEIFKRLPKAITKKPKPHKANKKRKVDFEVNDKTKVDYLRHYIRINALNGLVEQGICLYTSKEKRRVVWTVDYRVKPITSLPYRRRRDVRRDINAKKMKYGAFTSYTPKTPYWKTK